MIKVRAHVALTIASAMSALALGQSTAFVFLIAFLDSSILTFPVINDLLLLDLSVRYPARLALNPLVSTIGWYLPALFSGSLIVATVMNLPNIGPLLLRALINQDMYLAGSILLIYCFLTIVGTLISDILLAWLDPRIRFEEG